MCTFSILDEPAFNISLVTRTTTMSDTKFVRKRRAKKDVSQSQKKTTTKTPVSFQLRFPDLWQNPELVLSKMASPTRAARWLLEFILAKFPYIQSLTMIMLMAERALKLEKYPPMHPYIIYTIAVVSVVSGVMMSAKIRPKFAAITYSVVLAYLTYNAYTNKKFNYSKYDRNRMSCRHLGCMGVYLLYAFMKGNRTSKLLQRLGELCISTYLLGTAYLINESYEDRRAFMELVPGGHYARYFFTLILTCAGFCFISGYFLKDISMSVVLCLTFFLALVDIRFSYWSYRGMKFWNQLRLAADTANLVAGFFMFVVLYDSIAQEEAELRESEETDGENEDNTEDHEKAE